MCTQKQAYAILTEVCNSCKTLSGVTMKEAYLYGSYARGDFHADSDVDILLIYDADAPKIATIRKDIAKVSSKVSLEHDVTVSVTAKPKEQFEKFSQTLPYYKNVLREGIRYA